MHRSSAPIARSATIRARIGRFVAVYLDALIDVLADRDVKARYRRAMASEIESFTGVTDR